MTTTTAHLQTVVRHWPDLTEALATTRSSTTWPPAGRMSTYLAALDQLDAEEVEAERHRALALRTLERDPAQLGERPIPIRVRVFDTMRAVEAALNHCATTIASDVQRPPMSRAPRTWPTVEQIRRNQLADQDAADPRRWRWTGPRPTAPYAGLWLLARVEGKPGPFRPLSEAQHHRIGRVATEAAYRVETALDMARQAHTDTRPCPDCGGGLEVYGGDGRPPSARCLRCGRVWTQQDAPAA